LEALATKWASEKITVGQLARLGKIIEATEKAVQRNDTQAVVDLDTEFHDIICQASGSPRLNVMSQTLRDHMLRFRMKGLCDADVAERSNQGHRMIVDAIKNKDINEIELAVRFHLNRTMKDLKERIE
jgi:DNA-binding GntR family transcriptional regulator